MSDIILRSKLESVIEHVDAVLAYFEPVKDFEELQFLNEMNQFQLEGRYPDYEQKLYNIYKASNSKIILEKVTHIRKCLLEKLP